MRPVESPVCIQLERSSASLGVKQSFDWPLTRMCSKKASSAWGSCGSEEAKELPLDASK